MEVKKVEPLTERELAILSGKDPDKEQATPVEPESSAANAGADDKSAEQVTPEGAVDDAGNAGQAGNDAAKPDGKDADSGKDATGPQSWLSDDHKAVAKSYGISDDELKEFASGSEFTRAVRLIERSRSSQATEKPAPAPASTATPAAPAADSKSANTGTSNDDEIDVEAYRKEGYDENTLKLVSEVARLRKESRERAELDRARAEQAERVAAADRVRSLHSAIDSLDESKFGRAFDASGNQKQITPEQDRNRRRVYDAAMVIANGLVAQQKQQGKQDHEIVVPPLPALMQRAYQYEFAQEIAETQRRSTAAKIAAQSRTRRPVQSARPVSQPRVAGNTRNDQVRQIVDHPDVVAVWDKLTNR